VQEGQIRCIKCPDDGNIIVSGDQAGNISIIDLKTFTILNEIQVKIKNIFLISKFDD
jgi:WD40 repeat protein